MGVALVVLARPICPNCYEPLAVEHVHEPAMFRHGGYGATRLSVTRWCPGCGWWVLSAVGAARPDG